MPLFSERVSMLEVQNRALKKTARERAERIDELERELQQLAPKAEQHIDRRQREQLELEQAQHIAKLEGELQQKTSELQQKTSELQQKTSELQQKTRELERVKAEREFYCKQMAELEEHNRLVTDAATKYSLWGQKLFHELATLDPDGAPRRAFDTGSWM
jgi:DNA repair exonuclease SbcCD ATPase subunit